MWTPWDVLFWDLPFSVARERDILICAGRVFCPGRGGGFTSITGSRDFGLASTAAVWCTRRLYTPHEKLAPISFVFGYFVGSCCSRPRGNSTLSVWGCISSLIVRDVFRAGYYNLCRTNLFVRAQYFTFINIPRGLGMASTAVRCIRRLDTPYPMRNVALFRW